MVTLEQIQKKLASAISGSGKTQTAIAREIGIRQQTISHYIKGDICPALDTLANLCEVLDVDANDILCIHEYADNKKAVTISSSFNNNKGKIDIKI